MIRPLACAMLLALLVASCRPAANRPPAQQPDTTAAPTAAPAPAPAITSVDWNLVALG